MYLPHPQCSLSLLLSSTVASFPFPHPLRAPGGAGLQWPLLAWLSSRSHAPPSSTFPGSPLPVNKGFHLVTEGPLRPWQTVFCLFNVTSHFITDTPLVIILCCSVNLHMCPCPCGLALVVPGKAGLSPAPRFIRTCEILTILTAHLQLESTSPLCFINSLPEPLFFVVKYT